MNDTIYDYLTVIADEIGTDISNIRVEKDNDAQYLTGIEFALFLATGVLSTFLIPLISAFASKIGQALAEIAIERLKSISQEVNRKIRSGKTDEEQYKELAEVLTKDILYVLEHASDEKVVVSEVMNEQSKVVKDYLVKNNFPEKTSSQLAERIVRDIYNP